MNYLVAGIGFLTGMAIAIVGISIYEQARQQDDSSTESTSDSDSDS